MFAIEKNIYKIIKNSTTICFLFVMVITCFSCNDKYNSNKYKKLTLLYEYQLEIAEPSGLSESHLPDHFLTLCDDKGRIYLINIIGQIIKIIDIGGDDIEEIVYVEKDSMLYVVEERKRWVLKLNIEGERLDTFKLGNIPLVNINDGPEGITYNPAEDRFYIVNEKNPGMLYIYTSSFELIAEHNLLFAKDYSSVYYEESGNHLWILSDESKILARCNLEGMPEEIFFTGLPKGEGVLIDAKNKLIYIVCDITSKLYVYEMP